MSEIDGEMLLFVYVGNFRKKLTKLKEIFTQSLKKKKQQLDFNQTNHDFLDVEKSLTDIVRKCRKLGG